MTDTNSTPTAGTPKKPNNFLLDFGPLLIFFVAFQYFKRQNPDDLIIRRYFT